MRRRGGARWREEASASVALAHLGELELERQILVAGDRTGILAQGLQREGTALTQWNRFGLHGEPWPPTGRWPHIVMRLPRSKEGLEQELHALGARLREGGTLWIHGANDEGIRSLPKRLRSLFGEVDTADSRKHCRLVRARAPNTTLRPALEDWVVSVVATHQGQPLQWMSAPGTFAHGRMDEGTALLLNSLPELPAGARVADFGCGVGVVSLAVSGRGQVAVDMIDHDALALELAQRNVSNGRPILGSVPQMRGPYALIVSNPPLHDGRADDTTALQALVAASGGQLLPGGTLLMVTQRNRPLRDLLETQLTEVSVVAEDRRYRVWSAKRGPAKRR
jgi:16S rRNA (guanine1207-N2)-methyltransferase